MGRDHATHEETAGGRIRGPGRVALAVVAALLVVSTFTLLAVEWYSEQGPPRLNNPVGVGDAPPPAGDCLMPPSPQKALVMLVVRNLDRQALTLAVDVTLCLPPALQSRLVASTASSIVAPVVRSYRSGARYALRPYAHVPFGVEWTTGLLGRAGPHQLPVARSTTLGQLISGPGDAATFGLIGSPAVPLGQLVLPLVAAPRRYPLDWYELEGRLAVTIGQADVGLPPVAPVPPGVSAGLVTRLPVDVAILRDPNVEPLDLKASLGAADPEASRPVEIRLEHSAATRWYVLLVGSIPLLLAVLLLVATLNPRASPAPGAGPETLTGFTAALLAVLPIRLVLVPAAVIDLTLIDYWLGFEMALLAAVACLAVWRGI